jgi:uncharacterized protein YggE
MRNKILILAALMLFAMALSACGPALVAQAQTQPTQQPGSGAQVVVPPRSVSVSGSGKAYLDPDIAQIYIGVHTEAEEAAEAVETNNTQSQEVIDALRDLDIDAKDIQTTNFSIYPQQQYDPQGNLTGTRYAVDNTVFVTLRDLENLGSVLDAVIAAGANSINGIQFDVADRTAALSEARKAAVADAEVQAQELAEAAGLELGAIQTISTVGTGFPVPIFDGRGGGGAAAEAAASVPITPGQLVVSVDVTVVYAVE